MFVPDFEKSICHEIIPGRSIRINVQTSSTKTCMIYFVHNFGLSAPLSRMLVANILGAYQSSLDNPDTKAVVLMGDFNLEPKNAKRVRLMDASSISGTDFGEPAPRPHQRIWNQLFDSLIEIDFHPIYIQQVCCCHALIGFL